VSRDIQSCYIAYRSIRTCQILLKLERLSVNGQKTDKRTEESTYKDYILKLAVI